MPVVSLLNSLINPLHYEGEQTAADHDIYDFSPLPPGSPGPAPGGPQKERKAIADRLNWDMDYTTQSAYQPKEYVAPWDAEGWGGSDVKTTPPTRLQSAQGQIDAQPILPQRPGFQPGQTDYVYMPTEKEQRREQAANLATIARERGTRWQDTPLPGGYREAPEPTYGRWQDAKLPGSDEVRIQPIPDRDEVRIQPVPDRNEGRWGERIDWEPGTIGTTDWIDSDGDRTDDRYQTGPGAPRNPRGTWVNNETGQPWKSSGRGDYSPGSKPGQADRPEAWDDDPRLQEYTFQVSEDQSRPVKGGGGRRPLWSQTSGNRSTGIKRSSSRRARAFDVRDTWGTPRFGRGMDTSSTRNLDNRGVITDRMKYYRR
jgi:hypothetical protein